MSILQEIQEEYDLRYEEGITWRRLTRAYVEKVQFRVVSKYSTIGSVILDIGCGRGQLAYQLSRKQRHVVGIDFSRNGIKIAKRLAPNVEFLVASATSLPFRKGIFDMTYLFGTLEYVTNPNEFLLDAVKVVKQNGQVLFSITSRNRTPQNHVARLLTRKLFVRGRRKPIKRAKFSLSEIYDKMNSNQYCHVESISGLYFLLPGEIGNLEAIIEVDLNSNFLANLLASVNFLMSKSPIALTICGDFNVLLRKDAQDF